MLLSLSPSMILSKWAGDSEKAISGIFDIAKSFQPCIIFLVRCSDIPNTCSDPIRLAMSTVPHALLVAG